MTIPSDLAAALSGLPRVGVTQNGSAKAAVAPLNADDAAKVLGAAASVGASIAFVGSGSSSKVGLVDEPVVEMSSGGMADVIDWQVEDLTVTVGAGMGVGDLEAMLAERGQTSLLPVSRPSRTVGGVVAEAASGYGRLRYGPTRDRVLEVTMATGYGRLVRGGGRLVKNVTGYDLPRLATGSMGSLGFISSVCLKLWPLPRSRRIVPITDPSAAIAMLYRPFAVLETDDGALAVIEGPDADVERQAASIEEERANVIMPAPLDHPILLSVRVPAAVTTSAIELVADADGWIAQHGVGIIEAGFTRFGIEDLVVLRSQVSVLGGIVVVERPGADLADAERWGVPLQADAVQRRLKDQFDPFRVCNPGILPGGL